MSPCLIQQLFRQKVGKELDPSIVDDVLFPMLRCRKQFARELLLDIRLTQGSNEHGHSAIVICRVIDHNDDVPQGDTPKNISPFEVPMGPHDIWVRPGLLLREMTPYNRARRLPGKIPSQMRRLRHKSMWGSIDILNELRSLKRPQIREHSPSNHEEQGDTSGDEFEDVYLSLKEQPLRTNAIHAENSQRVDDLNFVNDYLEDALNNGKCLSWGGDPARANSFDSILTTYYY